jgi:RNA polymerase sigma-70 factor (ECF subfamily)
LSKEEFQYLFEAHFDALRTHIFYRCGDIDLASDIAQETFVRVWEKRDKLRDDHLKALLYKIANDFFVSNYRKKQTRDEYSKYIKFNELGDSPQDKMIYAELRRKYGKVLSILPETQRTAFLLNRNDGLSYSEIAIQLQISVKAVEKRISAALQVLRKYLLQE